MAIIESKVNIQAGEYPFGNPNPDEVALASGAVRILTRYRSGVENWLAVLPLDTTIADLTEAEAIAQVRFNRAVLGSMSNLRSPIEGREGNAMVYDPEMTGASESKAEVWEMYQRRMADIGRYKEKVPYGWNHEVVLGAAILYTAGIADHDWECREAIELAESRGYQEIVTFLSAVVPELDQIATIETYARTS